MRGGNGMSQRAVDPGASGAVTACLVGSFLLRCAGAATGVLLQLALARPGRGVSAVAVGLLGVSFYAAELTAAPLFGAESDRRGPRLFLLLGPAFGAVAAQLMGSARAIPALVAARVLQGLSTASSAPATLSYLSGATAGSEPLRGRVMGLFEIASVVGMAAGFVLGGVVWDALGPGAFTLVTAIYLASGAAFLRLQESSPPVPPAHLGLRARLLALGDPRLLAFAPAWLAVNAALGVWFTHSAFQLNGGRHPGQLLAGALSGSAIGLGFAAFGAAFTLGVALWGRAFGRLAKTTIMLVSLAGLLGACLVLFAINHQGAAPGPALVPLVALFLVGIGVASGFTPAALAYLADLAEARPGRQGAVMGLYSVLIGLGQLVGGALGGPFAERWSVDGLIALTAILGAVAVGGVLWLRRGEAPRPIASPGGLALP